MKQYLYGERRRLNLIWGQTAAGKSWIVNLDQTLVAYRLKRGQTYVWAAKNKDTLFRNIVHPILEIDRPYGWLTYQPHLSRIVTKKGAIIFLMGMNDEGATDSRQGGSYEGAYCDEVTTFPEMAWNNLIRGCRGKDENGMTVAKPITCTMNPDEDEHYIKRIMDTDPDARVMFFEWKDNPSLTAEEFKRLTSTFVGDFRARMVEGKWVGRLDQKIIPEATELSNWIGEWSRPKFFDAYGAVDIGHTDKSAYLCGYYDFLNQKYIVENEWVKTKATTRDIADGMRSADDLVFGKDVGRRESDIDPRLIDDMRKEHDIILYKVDKRQEQGAYKTTTANLVRLLFAQNAIIINPRCVNLIHTLKTGRWKKINDKITDEFERTANGHSDEIDALFFLIRMMDLRKNKNPIPAMHGLSRQNTEFSRLEYRERKKKNFEDHGLGR